MPIAVGAKRRRAVLIMLERSAPVNSFVVERGEACGRESLSVRFLAYQFAFHLNGVSLVQEPVETPRKSEFGSY
jgi:hypothetical protein